MTDKDTTAKDLETRRHMLAVAMRVYLTAEDCTVDDVNVALAAEGLPSWEEARAAVAPDECPALTDMYRELLRKGKEAGATTLAEIEKLKH
jgi:hypothetical protein